MRVEPAPSAADEALVLNDADFVREGDAGPASRSGGDGFERDASYEYREGHEGDISNARRITVPIDLGKFPPSGKLKVTFEVRIELDEEPKTTSKKKKANSEFYQELDRTR